LWRMPPIEQARAGTLKRPAEAFVRVVLTIE
jgi:hypothetical protein